MQFCQMTMYTQVVIKLSWVILTVLTCVIRLADHVNITPPPPLLPFIPIIMDIGVRANIHWGGGQTDFCPNGFRRWGGGGSSSRNFPGSIICGGKVVGDIFRGPCAPDSVGGGVMAAFFPLTAVTYPKFVLYNHVLCFARIMSTLSELYCRQTARIGGGNCPPSRTPMLMGK